MKLDQDQSSVRSININQMHYFLKEVVNSLSLEVWQGWIELWITWSSGRCLSMSQQMVLEGLFNPNHSMVLWVFPFLLICHGVKHCQGSSKAAQQQSSTFPVLAAVHKPGKPVVKRKGKGQEQELLQVETSGSRQKAGCKEWGGCRRLFGTD